MAGITTLLKGLTPEAKRLVEFFMKGKRIAQNELINPSMIKPEEEGQVQLITKFAKPYYEGTPEEISQSDLQRFMRAAEQGYNLPAWRAVRAFPDEDVVDPSFYTRGAHMDLTPSGHAARIFSRKFGQLADPSTKFTNLDPMSSDFWKTRLMSQVAVKPSRTPVFLRDVEVNSPEAIAKIFGHDPDVLFSGITEADEHYMNMFDAMKASRERLKRATELAREYDIDFLYPNIGEVDRSRMGPLSRAGRADKADLYLNRPRLASWDEFMKNKKPATYFGDPLRENLPFEEAIPLPVRMEMAEELLRDPRKMSLIGNPSFVVTDPTRMRDLGLAEFRDPYSKFLYRKCGGLATLRK